MERNLKIETETRRQLIRLKDGLAEINALYGENTCRCGMISASPSLELEESEWACLGGHQAEIKLTGTRSTTGVAKPTIVVSPDGTSCLTYRGSGEAVEAFRFWLKKASVLLPILIGRSGLGVRATEFELVRSFFQIAVTVTATKWRLVAPELFCDSERRAFPYLAEKCKASKVSVIEEFANVLASNTLTHVLGQTCVDQNSPEAIARQLMDEFQLAKVPEENQAMFVQILRSANGEYRQFAFIAAQAPGLFDGINPTRLKDSLPTALRERIESKRGHGYRWLDESQP